MRRRPSCLARTNSLNEKVTNLSVSPVKTLIVPFSGPPSRTDRPSGRHAVRVPNCPAIVGTTSMLRTIDVSIVPRLWPGYLMNRGTAAMSAAVSGVISRRGRPGRKLTPWSAVKMTMARSKMAARRRRLDDPRDQPIRVASLQQVSLHPDAGCDRFL